MKTTGLLFILILFPSTSLFSQIKIGVNPGVTIPFTTQNDLIDIRYNQPDSLITSESTGIYKDIIITKEIQNTFNLNLLLPFATDSAVSFFYYV